MEKHFALFQRLATGDGSVDCGLLSKGQLPTPESQWARAFPGEERGLPAETAQSAQTVILKWVTGGLTSVTLITYGYYSVPGSVCSHFFEALGTAAAYVMPTVWSSCS